MDPNRSYTPGQASVGSLRQHLASIGFSRAVLVQPSIYGTNNQCMADAIAAMNGFARGVAVVRPDIDKADLVALHKAGFRGARLNYWTANRTITPENALTEIQTLGKTLTDLGWHIQIYCDWAFIETVVTQLGDMPLPLVFDHHIGVNSSDLSTLPGGQAFLDLMEKGAVYVKLSAPYRLPFAADYDRLAGLTRSLVSANPQRCLWASDWPHTGGAPRGSENRDRIEPFRNIDDGADLARFVGWVGDAKAVTQILQTNPAHLYDFDDTAMNPQKGEI